MYPNLLTFSMAKIVVHIYSYGFFIIIGFILSLEIVKLRCIKLGSFKNEIIDFSFWAFIGGIIGARLLFIIVEYEYFFSKHKWDNLLSIKIPSIFAIWNGGLVYWGGFFGSLAACIIFAKIKRLPKLHFLDLVIVGVPIIQAFGRLGCLFAGCCYGKILNSEHSIGLKFPSGSVAFDALMNMNHNSRIIEYMVEHKHTWPLFPSQLLESFVVLVIYFILLLVSNRKKFHGQVFFTYIVLYSTARLFMEIFRGDTERGYLINGILSTSQFISLLTLLLGVVFLIFLEVRNRGIQNNIISKL